MERGEKKMSAKKRRDLEDVLNDYLASEPTPSHEGLKRWIKMFPEYKTQLTQFTVDWGVMECATEMPEELQSDKDTLVLRAMSIVGDCLHAHKQKQNSDRQITSLLDEAQRCGLDLQDVAGKCNITLPILVKLSRRIIDYKTIPNELIHCIGKIFEQSPESLQAYFKGPVLATGIHFSSKRTPTVQKSESFFNAVRSDKTLNPKIIQYWLSVEKQAFSQK